MTDRTPVIRRTDLSDERDPALNGVLQEWRAPEASRDLDRRIMEDYRKATRSRPLWHRFFFTSVRVPLPVAVAALALLFIAAAAVIRRQPDVTTVPPAVTGPGGLQASHAEPPLVIHTSLEGFQPVSDANVTVMEEHRQ
ncbi:MAG: hypothetical protein JXA73_04120 [Acidobacteria bacterium]|nr:hypothetical protein [Acidobacteriota bacterium]